MPRPSKKSIKFLTEQVNYYHGCAENAPRESDEYAENSFNDVRILKCFYCLLEAYVIMKRKGSRISKKTLLF